MNHRQRLTWLAHPAVVATAGMGAVACAALLAFAWACKCPHGRNVTVLDAGPMCAESDSAEVVAGDSRPTLHIAVAARLAPRAGKHFHAGLLRVIGDRVGRRVVLSQRMTYAEINDLLERREIDLAFVGSGPYVAGRRKFGMEILAVPVVDGARMHHCYIIANRHGPVRCLEDLCGKKFAYTDPGSHAGCLVPQYMLAGRGYDPETFFGKTIFTHAHDHSIKAVAAGVVDGAAVDHLIWEFLAATSPDDVRETKIVAKSLPFGMPPVVVNPQLPAALKDRLRAVFLSLHESVNAIPYLRALRIDRFEAADDAMYDSARQMASQATGWSAQTAGEELR